MLIFDLGFHNGDDTDYYLKKGAKVIAVEANPDSVGAGLFRFEEEISNGQLILLHALFCNEKDSLKSFYLNDEHSDWGTGDFERTKFLEGKWHFIQVPTVNLQHLIQEYGTPQYIKTDIEGFDPLVLKQLFSAFCHPKYLSFELSRFNYWEFFSYLHLLGYSEFKLVNQTALDKDKLLNYEFGQYHSGMFGEDIPGWWMDIDTCLTRYIKYKELKAIDNKNLALGWIDIHAKYNSD
jgi:FkbM family methyltransferase